MKRIFNSIRIVTAQQEPETSSGLDINQSPEDDEKDAFIRTLHTKKQLALFKKFLRNTNGNNLLEFIELYLKVERKVSEHFERIGEKPLARDLFKRFKQSQRGSSELSSTNSSQDPRDVPMVYIGDFLMIYSTFFSFDSSNFVPFAPEIRKYVDDRIRTIGPPKLQVNLYDEAALEAMNNLFNNFYTKYCGKIDDQQSNHSEDTEMSASSSAFTLPAVISRKPTRNKNSEMSGKKHSIAADSHDLDRSLSVLSRNHQPNSPTQKKAVSGTEDLSFTKDFFAMMFRAKNNHFLDFKEFTKVEMSKENMEFYEEYAKLEDMFHEQLQKKVGKASSVKYPKAMQRFVDREKPDSAGPLSPLNPSSTMLLLPQELYIPATMVSHAFHLYTTYIVPGAPKEVNITNKCRKRIQEALGSSGGNRVPFTVFDEAVEEILRLLYSDVFKRFVTNRYKKSMSQFFGTRTDGNSPSKINMNESQHSPLPNDISALLIGTDDSRRGSRTPISVQLTDSQIDMKTLSIDSTVQSTNAIHSRDPQVKEASDPVLN